MKLFWIFDPDAVWALIPLSSALWAFGGSGVKPLRRFLLPIVLGLSAWSFKAHLWGWIPSALSLCGASTLPYGDDCKKKLAKLHLDWLYWWVVYAVGASYGVSLMLLLGANKAYLCMAMSPLLTGSTFGVGMTLSKGSAKLPWKVVEMATGAVIGGLWALGIFQTF